MLIPTDIRDPETGEPLYVNVRWWPVPWWLRVWRWLCLFCGIVWRTNQIGGRISVRTAWAVCSIIHGRTAPR